MVTERQAPGKLTMKRKPIVKQLVRVTGNEAPVFLDERGDKGNDFRGNGVGNNNQTQQGISVTEQLKAIQASLMSLQREVIQLKAAHDEEKVVNGVLLSHNFSVVNSNLRSLATQLAGPVHIAQQQGMQSEGDSGEVVAGPVHIAQQQGMQSEGDSGEVLLCPRPRSLHDLWEEYVNGLDGRKPARLLAYHERGRVKHKFHRRKVVWDLISGLIRQGLTANAAIDRIYSVYGAQTSVTTIINAVKYDKKHQRLNSKLTVR
jgi:Transcriptional activator of glycolytic enzymes